MNSGQRTLAAALAAILAGCQTSEVLRGSAGRRTIAPVRGLTPSGSPEMASEATRHHASGSAPTTPQQSNASRTDSAIQLASHESKPSPVPPAAPMPFRLTLAQAIETGLAQNPDLVTQHQAERVSEAALGVAQTYPFNPWVQVQATPYQHGPGGSVGRTNHYVLLMQQIQLAHQQRHRESAACAALNSTRWNIFQAQLLNVAQTERLYFAALYQKGVRDLTRATADNNQQLLAIMERQLQAGQATAADVSIIRLDVRATRQQAELADANFETALLDLKRQLGLPISTPLELTEDLTHWTWLPADASRLSAAASGHSDDHALPIENSDEVIASLVGYRPDVLAARADIDTARANFALADASRTPDLQLGPYYQRNEGDLTSLGFRAQIDLPVINNGRPLVCQRQAELHQRVVAWQQLQTRAELEARAAIDRYERARRFVMAAASTNDTALPTELQRLEEQFRANEVDMLRVFQARTSLIQSRRAYLDTLNELAQSAVAITAATGAPTQALATYEP